MSLEWESCKIGELGKIFSGGTPSTKIKEYWDGDLNWLSSGETRNTYIYTTDKFITEKGANNSSTKLANKGDIVIASAGQGFTRGQSSMVMIDTYVNQSVIVISPNDKVNNHYLLYNLKFRYPELRQLSDHASTRGSLTTKIIKDLDIILPDLNTQNKIATIIQYFDKKIETNKKINKNLTRLSSIIFTKLIEKNNEFMELQECCKFIKGKKPKEISDYPQPNFLDYLTIDVLSNQSQMYASDEKGVLANEYDILMVMDGASSGKLFYGKSGLVGSTLAKLDVDDKYLEIVYQFLKHSEKFISDNTTGSAIPHTDKGLVLNLKCPISEKLLNFSNTFKSIRSSIITNNNEILKLQKLRDTLLPKLMSGEIDVSKINCDMLQTSRKNCENKFTLTLQNNLTEAIS